MELVRSCQVGLHPRTGATLGQRGLPPPPMSFLGEGPQQEVEPARWVSQLRATEEPRSNSSLGARPQFRPPCWSQARERHSEPSSVHVQQEVLQELRGRVHLKGPNWDNEHLRK